MNTTNTRSRPRIVPLTAEQAAAARGRPDIGETNRFWRDEILCGLSKAARSSRRGMKAGEAYRDDFSEARYNVLYAAVDAWWMSRMANDGSITIPDDYQNPVNIENVRAYIVDWGNANSISSDDCLGLIKEIEEERKLIQELKLEECLQLFDSDVFAAWLNSKISRAFVDNVKSAIRSG